MLNKIDKYTEKEFLDLLIEIFITNRQSDNLEEFFNAFNQEIQHPDKSDLLTHPTQCGIDDNLESVVSEIKRWYSEQEIKCFKDS